MKPKVEAPNQACHLSAHAALVRFLVDAAFFSLTVHHEGADSLFVPVQSMDTLE